MSAKQNWIWLGWKVLTWTLALMSLAELRAQPRIKLSTQAPSGGSVDHALLVMAQKLRKAPCGGVNLTPYLGGTQGDEAATVSRMRVDSLQAALLTVTGLEQIDNSVTSLQVMPMVFRDLAEVRYIRDKITPRISERFQSKGFVVLGWGDLGWVRYFSVQPVLRPSDLARMKIFAWAGDPRQADLMTSLGYRPVVLTLDAILPALQTGMIDVVATIPYHALSGQLDRNTKHMLELNWVPLVGALVVTKRAWDGLCPEARQELARAGSEAVEELVVTARTETVSATNALRKRGVTIHPVPPALEAEWRAWAQNIYPQIRGRLVPADMFDEVQRLLAARRAAEGK